MYVVLIILHTILFSLIVLTSYNVDHVLQYITWDTL